jgi:hypothetical protein
MKRFTQGIILLFIVLVLVLGGFYIRATYQTLKVTPSPSPAPASSTPPPVLGRTPTIQNADGTPVLSADYVKYYGHDGRNAFELLKALDPSVGYKQYSFGVLVESIGGVTPDNQHFWKLYLNGQASQVGADQLQLHDGDVVEWKIDKINK